MALTLILQKRKKNCEEILSKFREEVCRNANADVAPYAQTLAAEFRTWNKAWEKEIIKTLFLNLYANDVQALRRDLCKLDPPSVLCKLTAHGAAKAKFPQRALLLYCLYGVLPLYHRGDFASIVKICSQGMEPDWGKYEIDGKKHEMDQILSAFKEEICRNPDIDFAPLIVNEYGRMRDENVVSKPIWAGRSVAQERYHESGDVWRERWAPSTHRPRRPAPMPLWGVVFVYRRGFLRYHGDVYVTGAKTLG